MLTAIVQHPPASSSLLLPISSYLLVLTLFSAQCLLPGPLLAPFPVRFAAHAGGCIGVSLLGMGCEGAEWGPSTPALPALARSLPWDAAAALCPAPWAGCGAGFCPCYITASQCCHPTKPNIPAWAWRTLGINKRGKGLLAVLCGGDHWVLGWVLWCLHGQSGPGLLSACRQLRETWLSHKTCWKRKLSSITALVRRLHVAGHDPGSGADQEGRIWIRPGRRC